MTLLPWRAAAGVRMVAWAALMAAGLPAALELLWQQVPPGAPQQAATLLDLRRLPG